MARLDYVGTDTPPGQEGEIVERIRTRRGGALRPLDRMLLHSPPLADGWNDLLGAVRTATTLGGDVRELAILRIAALNDARYEWDAHEPLGRRFGLSDIDLAVLRDEHDRSGLSPRLAAALDYTDAMTTSVRVPDPVFAALREHFDDRQVVELTVTVGAYNLVSRFLVALEVGEERPDAPNDDEEAA
jgi:4-carboxymuconolactone decarboxylase